MVTTRPPAVAGSFYPSDATALAAEVDRHLANASPAAAVRPKAVIAPHAGYPYSGPIAGSAFRPWRDDPPPVRRVVLLGPAHTRPCWIAASGADAFATPLGEVPIDRAGVDALVRAGLADVDEAPHAAEHSLEVELPFLQRLFPHVDLLPLVVGDAEPDEVARLLEACWGGPETVVVVSSDLSHYLDAETARQVDTATARAIEQLRFEAIDVDQACGARPVAGLLAVAARRGLRVSLADLRNSGDTAGPADRVVGYGAFHVIAAR
jgi:AmmeMemoRadiSam system protein B